MDFSPEELDVSPPCFLVENSQADESQQLGRSDSDHHVTILKRLPVFAVPSRDPSSCSTNESAVSRNPVAISCPAGGGEGGRQGEPGNPRGVQRDGGQGQEGGGVPGDVPGGDGDHGADRGGGGGEGGYGGGGGDGDRGGGGDDDGDDDNNGDENDEESPPAEEPSSSSSSDALPMLVRPETVLSNDQCKGQKFSASEMLVQHASERRAHNDSSSSGVIAEHGSGGSVHDSSGDHYSQASTGIVGAGEDVAAEMPSDAGSGSLSEASTAPLEAEKKSTSSSSVGHKSEAGSASSSSYHGDLSSMSSGGSHSISPEVRKHLPLQSMLRTQSTSDTSSSSAGSKGGKIHSKVGGFRIMSLKEEDESVACSSQEDMFAPREREKEPEHVHSDLSEDSSHILPPQHHSTPTEVHSTKGSHEQVHEKSLYQQVLTTKQRTSTPVEGGGFLPTPPSQGTPIDNIGRFQSLQFSGEPSARETSSSDKVSPSPEERSSIPILVPSSPTTGEDESAEEKTSRKQTSNEVERSIAIEPPSEIQEQSEIARVAAELVVSFDLSEKEHLEQPASLKHKETLDEEEVMIPRWQQLQEIPQQGSVCTDKKSTSSNNSSSERSSSDSAVNGESQPPQMQEWQSVISAMGSTSSTSQGAKLETARQVSTSNDKDQPLQFEVVDMSFLESSKPVPHITKEQYPKEAAQRDQSLSPSSLAVDPFNPDYSSRRGTEEPPVIAVGPTQPEMSEDMFSPRTTQGSAEQQDIAADKPIDEPMEGDSVAENSQEIIFSLHLTQSQTDMESQMPPETSLQMEEIQEEVTVTEGTRDLEEHKPVETTQTEQVVSLTKQDSSSQSILAPLIQPSGIKPLHVPSVAESGAAKGKDLEHEQQQPGGSDRVENVVLSRSSPLHEETKGDESSGDVIPEKEPPHPSTENVTVVSPPEQRILVEDSGGVVSSMKEDASEDLARRQFSTPEKDVLVRRPIKPRLPATIFSETSSESGPSGGFHFSLPKEPLRPFISTTPPPIRPVRHDTPDSQERGSRRSIIPDVVLPVVSETPGMSSQAPPSSFDQLRPQSLTISMPRHGSPVSDSENSEPVFRFDTTLPSVSTTPGSSASVRPSAPEPPQSIFSRAREALAKGKKREKDLDSEHDPFAFTVEDEDPEPVRKRPRRGSPRAERRIDIVPRREVGEIDKTREVPVGGAEERPSSSGDQSVVCGRGQDASTEPSSLQEKASAKRSRQDESSDPAGSERADEYGSKRARKEEDEPKSGEELERASPEVVNYRQITHTRTVTTVTTQVQRVVTVRIVDKESGEIVQVLTYEEDDRPKIESEEREKEEVDEFMESSSLDGSRVMLAPKSPKRQQLQQQRRSSPRVKNGKTSVESKSVSKPVARDSDKTQSAMASPGRRSSDRGRDEVGVKGDLPRTRDEPVAEIPVITRQATVPVIGEEEPALQRTSSSDSSLTPGTRVLAKWLDGYFYPGVVTTKQYKNGRYLVTFDDGDKRRIPRENIIVKDLLPAGQSVMAQGDVEDDFYEQGVIVSHYRDGNERGYEIQIRSGAISRFPRNRVILSEQQAAAILSSESSLNVTSGSSVSIGTHSLRLRKDTSAGSSGENLQNVTKSGSTAAKDTSRDTSSKDTSSSSSDEKKRGKKAAHPSPQTSPRASKATTSKSADETPKSTHKSTHKAKAEVRRAGLRIGESESSSDEQHGARQGKKRQARRGLSASYGAESPGRLPTDEPFEPPTTSKGRMQMRRKEDDIGEDTATVAMPVNRNLFAGLAFLVTGIETDRTEPDESDSESERIEFNRDNVKRQIEAGGGVVLSSFPQSQISGAECFLVSNRHQRTQKYFQSLASGIPCVSHMWINDCCACDQLLDYRRYLLPAGESLEADGVIVECRPRKNILGNMRVYLHGSQKFKDTWTSVLLAAGCKMVTKIPNRLDYQCDVVICEDNKLPASVKHAANLLGIPIVSLEWLLQSLINGRQMPFDGHPKYDYRSKSS